MADTLSFTRLSSGMVKAVKNSDPINIPGDCIVDPNPHTGKVFIVTREYRVLMEFSATDTITKTVDGSTSSVSGTAEAIADSLTTDVFFLASSSGASAWGDLTGTLSDQTDLQTALDEKVASARTLTIDGVTHDLSANRSWTTSGGASTDILLTKNISYWEAIPASTSPFVLSFPSSSSGTATARTPADTNYFTRRRRMAYVSSTSSGQNAGLRASTYSSMGEGFTFRAAFGIGVHDAGMRIAVGMHNLNTDFGNADPSTFTSWFGVYANAADTNLKIIGHDGSSASTPVDLGANFPAKTSASDWYVLVLTITGSGVTYDITRYDTSGASTNTTGSIANYPASTVLMHPKVWCNNGASTTAVAIDISKVLVYSNE
jgi:hypothetical protein